MTNAGDAEASASAALDGIDLIVALGGFLMGFDAAVIAGAVGAIEIEFALTKIQLGWSVSSLWPNRRCRATSWPICLLPATSS